MIEQTLATAPAGPLPAGPTGSYVTLQYDPNGMTEGIDLSTVEVLATQEQGEYVLAWLKAALAAAGATAALPNLAIFEEGVGKFSYFTLPGDPRGPIGINSTAVVNGVTVVTPIGDFVAQFVAAIQRNPNGKMIYAPIPNSPDVRPVFQWV